MRKLTVVVTCTNRKSLSPSPGLRARDLPQGSVSERSDIWRGRLRGAVERKPVGTLYRGEAWAQVPGLLKAATAAGFRPTLFVASAGLGLREASSSAPGYSATFSPGHADSVGDNRQEMSDWWRTLRAIPEALDPRAELQGQVLMVLSEAYANVLRADLRAIARRGANVLLVGGASDVPGVTRLPSDKGLRHLLGGTATSLNLRMARTWLERLTHPCDVASQEDMHGWQVWAGGVRQVETWNRRVVTDDEVLAYIRFVTAPGAVVSRTRALRMLRDDGMACEQKRFAALYDRTVTAV